MPRFTIYPLGNADTALVDLANGKKLLFDYADVRDPNNEDDKRIDLPVELRKDLKAVNRKHYDVVAISHLDNDHTAKADQFFFLDSAKKYQADDRIKITQLWVPAGVITESRNNLEEGAKAIQAEARHRLRKGYGIRVFSRPELLKDWLEENGLTIESRKHLITDAGQLVPDFSLSDDGVEFFVHSPFAWRQDDDTVFDRNRDSLAMQLTFQVDSVKTKVLLGSDLDHIALTDIVEVTKAHNREERLEWDVCKLMHHCSYLSLGPDRGVDKTEPVPALAWLFEDQGQRGCTIVSTSKPIPKKGTTEDKDVQPPHRQAANYYKEVVNDKDGLFVVTMEHPDVDDPKPVVIEIDNRKATVKMRQAVGAAAVTSVSAPRAG